MQRDNEACIPSTFCRSRKKHVLTTHTRAPLSFFLLIQHPDSLCRLNSPYQGRRCWFLVSAPFSHSFRTMLSTSPNAFPSPPQQSIPIQQQQQSRSQSSSNPLVDLIRTEKDYIETLKLIDSVISYLSVLRALALCWSQLIIANRTHMDETNGFCSTRLFRATHTYTCHLCCQQTILLGNIIMW